MSALNIAVEVSSKGGQSAANDVSMLGRALEGLERTGTVAAKAVAAVTVAAAGMAAGGFAYAVKSASEFEQTLSGVKAVSGATAEEMDGLGDLALELGAKTSFSAKEAAAGIEELVKGGVSIPDIMSGAAQSMLDLAAAGGVEVPEAATIAANSLALFNLKGQDMAHVADLIAGAANASAMSVGDFSFSMKAAGSVAATVGFSFDDMATSIALMAKAGITGSDAGTSLKTMMMNLVPSTEKAEGLMEELGIITEWGANRFFDATGKVKSMAEVSQILAEATKDLTKEQQLAALSTLFGSDAIRAAAVISKEGAAGFNAMAEAMSKVSAQEVAKERLNNLKGSVEQLKGSLDTAAITFGVAFLPLLKSGVDAATGLVNEAIPILSTWAPLAAEAIASGAPIIVDKVTGIVNLVKGVLGGLAGGGDQGQTQLGLMQLLGLDLSQASDITEQIQGIVSIVRENFGMVSQAVGEVAANVQGHLLKLADIARKALGGDLAGAVTDLLDFMLGTRIELVETLGSWSAAFLEWLEPLIGPLMTELGNVAQAVFSWVQERGPEILEKLQEWGRNFVEFIGPFVPPMMAALTSLVDSVFAWLQENAPAIMAQLQLWGQQFVDFIAPFIPPLLEQAGILFQSILTWIGENAPPLLQKLVTDWLPAALHWLVQAAIDVLPKLLDFANTVLDWISDNGPGLAKQFVSEWLPAALEWIANLIVDIIPKLFEFLYTIGKWVITEASPKVMEIFGKLGLAIIDGIIAGAQANLQRLQNFITNVGQSIVETGARAIGARSPSQLTREMIGEPYVEGIIIGIEQGMPRLVGAVDDLLAPSLERGALLLAEFQNDLVDVEPAFSSVASVAEIFGSTFGELVNPALEHALEDLIPEISEEMDGMSDEMWQAIQMAGRLASAIRNIPSVPGGGGGGGGHPANLVPLPRIDFGGSSGGGFGSFGGGLANGGTARAGGTYLVGERGPEILSMGGSSGYVTSNSDIIDYDKLAAALARQPIYVTIDRRVVGEVVREHLLRVGMDNGNTGIR